MPRQIKTAKRNPPRLDDTRSIVAAMRRGLRPDPRPMRRRVKRPR